MTFLQILQGSDEWTSEINGAVPLVPVEGYDDGSESQQLSDVVPEQ